MFNIHTYSSGILLSFRVTKSAQRSKTAWNPDLLWYVKCMSKIIFESLLTMWLRHPIVETYSMNYTGDCLKLAPIHTLEHETSPWPQERARTTYNLSFCQSLYRQEIGFCSREQLRKMFANFYPDSTPEEAVEFSTAVDDGEVMSKKSVNWNQIMIWINESQFLSSLNQVSAAQVQGFFMFFKQSGRAAIENAFRLCSKSNNAKPKAEKSEQ